MVMTMLRKKSSLLLAGLLLSGMISTPVLAATDDDMGLEELQQRVAHNEWIKVREDRIHNMTAWYKIEDGKRVRSFKVEAVLDSSYEDVAKTMLDLENTKRWFWECLDSKLLKKISDTEYMVYLKINAPQPLPDRDDILHVKIEPYSKKRGYMVFNFNAMPNYIPSVPNFIRIAEHAIAVKLTPMSASSTKLEVEGYVDPGGSIPAWAINHVQRNAAYISVLGLARRAKQGEFDHNTPLKINED